MRDPEQLGSGRPFDSDDRLADYLIGLAAERLGEKDRAAAARKRELDPKRGVPFAIINGRLIHGYSESAYERALR